MGEVLGWKDRGFHIARIGKRENGIHTCTRLYTQQHLLLTLHITFIQAFVLDKDSDFSLLFV